MRAQLLFTGVLIAALAGVGFGLYVLDNADPANYGDGIAGVATSVEANNGQVDDEVIEASQPAKATRESDLCPAGWATSARGRIDALVDEDTLAICTTGVEYRLLTRTDSGQKLVLLACPTASGFQAFQNDKRFNIRITEGDSSFTTFTRAGLLTQTDIVEFTTAELSDHDSVAECPEDILEEPTEFVPAPTQSPVVVPTATPRPSTLVPTPSPVPTPTPPQRAVPTPRIVNGGECLNPGFPYYHAETGRCYANPI